MEASAIAQVLTAAGWKAEVVSRSQVEDLVEVNGEGLLKCVDGRLSDCNGMRGPKMLGGVYAIATSRGVSDLDGLRAIVREVKEAGFVPSVHGDEHASPPPMGCGFFKLWATGQLTDLAPPQFDAEQGKVAVLEEGGVYEQLIGSHGETEVLINLVPDTTFEPCDEQRFVVDAWAAAKFGLDLPDYLTRAAETVTKLGGPLVARIVVE